MRAFVLVLIAARLISALVDLQLVPSDVYIDDWSTSDLTDVVIDTAQPHFSWRIAAEFDANGNRIRGIAQTHYRLTISRINPVLAAVESEPLVDTGIIASSSSQYILDKDMPLQSDTSYQWCIAYTSNSGRNSLQKCGHMRTSLLSSTALESAAMWIGSNDSSAPINQVRYDFVLPKNLSPVRATAFICGIGYNQLWINGRQVDPTRQLDPTWTTYERTLYYTSFDVLPFVQPAGNAIGVNLGGGWFSQSMHYAWQLPKPNYGPPRMIFLMNIVLSDGSTLNVTSHTGWTGRIGPIQFDHIYHGEFRDGRFERDGWSNYSFVDRRSLWRAVDAVVSPGGTLRLQALNPIRSGPTNLHVKVNQSSTNPAGVVGAPVVLPDGYIHAANISQPIRSVFIVDFGQNFAGFIRIFMKGTPGWPLVIRYGEALLSLPADESTHVLQASFRGATQSDTYILRGDADGEWYQPTNTYHGFRYVSIFRPFGDFTVDQVIGIPIHTETSLIGRFVSSSAILNQIQHNLQYGMLSQAMGIFSDCPSRDERMGWMDDLLLTSDQGMYNFDLAQFYAAFLDNMDDAQLPNFNYPDTTPMMLDESNDPNWSSAPIVLAWKIFKHTGDLSVIARHYSNYALFIDYWYGLYNRTGLVNMPGEYGDWSPPAPQSPIPPQLPSSFIFMYDILLFINMSRLLNQTGAVESFTRLYYDQLAPEFHRVFYQTSAQCYLAGCPQPAQVLALDLPSVVPDPIRPTILTQLVQSIKTIGYYTGGETSYARLWYVLSDNGYHDLAVQLAISTSYPSLGYQFKNDFGVYATTLWEIFNAYEKGLPGMNSLNHVMFSTVGQWYYERLAGIELIPYESSLVIHPRVPFDHTMLHSVMAEHVTRKGTISVEWRLQSPLLTGDSFSEEYLYHIHVVLPDNIPTTDVVFEPILSNGKCQQIVLIEQNDANTDVIVLWNGVSSNNLANEHGVKNLSVDDRTNAIVAQLESGSYRFVATWKEVEKDFAKK